MLMKEKMQSDMSYRDRLQELEMKILEMKYEDSKQNNILEQLIGYLPTIIPMLNKKATSTVAPKISGRDPEVDSDRLAGVLDKFAALDPDYINTLEKMAAAVEENPAILPALKSNL